MANKTVSVTDVRLHFAELLKTVVEGDVVFLTRHNKAVAALVPAELAAGLVEAATETATTTASEATNDQAEVAVGG